MSAFTTFLGSVVILVVLAFALRATFGTGRDQHVPDPDDPTGDGLLVEVARAPDEAGARAMHARLRAGGVRATLGRVGAEHRVLVFPGDEVTAKLLLL